LLQWLSTHPNSGDRMQLISKEIEQMGGSGQPYSSDSPDFRVIQRLIKTLPPPKEKPKVQQVQDGKKSTEDGPGPQRQKSPSRHLLRYEGQRLLLRYPQNWKVSEQNKSATLTPENGWVTGSQGNRSLAYGMIVSVTALPQPIQNPQDLEQATAQLIRNLQQANPKMRVAKPGEPIRAGRERALATTLANDSPLGGTETVWLVTVAVPDGLLHMICVAPEKEFGVYFPAFRNVVDSLTLR
jgi:hypothetical protein